MSRCETAPHHQHEMSWMRKEWDRDTGIKTTVYRCNRCGEISTITKPLPRGQR